MNEPIRLEYLINADDYVTAGAASHSVKETLKMIGIPSDVCRRAAIIMYEAEMNLVIHANGGKVLAEIYKDKIKIETSDEGPGIPDIALAVTEGFTTANDTAREMGFGAGMGLPNINRNADTFEITSVVGKGTELKTVIFLK